MAQINIWKAQVEVAACTVFTVFSQHNHAGTICVEVFKEL